ncbi:MAG TPA: hypothetical protein VNF72_17805 [Myxococcota bacterium]|nr:hypothetical protein [Myxococcota bacterium]
MSWYAWSVVWWVGLGAVLAVATNGGQGWRKWWVRVAAILLSITTVQQFGPRVPEVTRVLASSPDWMQGVATSVGRGLNVGLVAQIASTDPVVEIERAAQPAPRP